MASGLGWSAIVTGSGPFRLIRRFGPTGPLLEVSPEGERLVSSLNSVGSTLYGLQSSQPFPLVHVSRVRRQRPGRLPACSRRGGGIWARGAQKMFDSQRTGGYSPLDFPLLGGLCWASWRQSEQGGAVYVEPRSKWSTRPGDGSDTHGEIPGNGLAVQPEPEGCRSESED